jgi:hypothetical protein
MSLDFLVSRQGHPLPFPSLEQLPQTEVLISHAPCLLQPPNSRQEGESGKDRGDCRPR